jgi:prepilin-type N-terminal cleavage/methylation domain-containing protein
MRLNRLIYYRQAGDTLIEVMIAVAIISLVITVSYATANRSLQIGRRTQESTEALKIAESQLEILKSMGDLRPDAQDIFGSTSTSPARSSLSFCVEPSTIYAQNAIVSDVFSPSANLNTEVAGTIPTGTMTYNAACAVGPGARYKRSITREDIGEQSTFTVRVRWESVSGRGDEVALVYKLHKRQYGKS